jgi:crossover junction endodeoxyribonuclease RuvC
MLQNKTVVVSVDPGFDRFGVAIVERNTGKDSVVFSDCIQTDKKLNFEIRLLNVIDEFETIIKNYKPEILCMESVFMHKNAKSVINVAEIKGAVKLIAAKHGIKIVEMTPQKIKLAVAGSGAAKKDEVIKMVKLITKHKSKTGLDDEYDAVACGLAALAYLKTF